MRRAPGFVYQRADGTVTRFFEAEDLQAIFVEAGFESVRCGYECRELRNRKTKIKMYRNWVSIVLKKPGEMEKPEGEEDEEDEEEEEKEEKGKEEDEQK